MKTGLAAYSGLLQTSTLGDYAKIVSDVIFSSKKMHLGCCTMSRKTKIEMQISSSQQVGTVV